VLLHLIFDYFTKIRSALNEHIKSKAKNKCELNFVIIRYFKYNNHSEMIRILFY